MRVSSDGIGDKYIRGSRDCEEKVVSMEMDQSLDGTYGNYSAGK